MAKAAKVETVTSYTLHLDPEEAGYLLSLLDVHVGRSPLMLSTEPLGRIHAALRGAEVKQRRAVNERPGGAYASLRAQD